MKYSNVDLNCQNYPNWKVLAHPGLLCNRYYFHGFEVHSQTSTETIEYLLESVRTINNGKIVEIGVFGGWVSLHLAEAALKTNSKMYSIDVWEKIETGNGSPIPERQLDATRYYLKQLRCNYENILDELNYFHTTVINESSLTAVNQFENESLDLVFIDGDHSKEHLYKELTLWYPKLKKNGFLFGDDFNWDGAPEVIYQFGMENNLDLHTNGRIWNLKS